MRILRHGPLGFWILPAAWALTAGTLDSQRRAKMACGVRASNWDPEARGLWTLDRHCPTDASARNPGSSLSKTMEAGCTKHGFV